MAEFPWQLFAQGSGLGIFLSLVAFVVFLYRRQAKDGEETYRDRLAGLSGDLDAVRVAAALLTQRHDSEMKSINTRLQECRAESADLYAEVGKLRQEVVALKVELAAHRAGGG